MYSTIPEGVPLTAQSEGPVPGEGGLARCLYLYSKCSTCLVMLPGTCTVTVPYIWLCYLVPLQ